MRKRKSSLKWRSSVRSMFRIPRTELTAYQHKPDLEIRSHNTPILQLSCKQLLDLSRSMVSAPSGLLSFASVSRSVQCQFTPGSRLQSLFDPPPSPTPPAPTTCLSRFSSRLHVWLWRDYGRSGRKRKVSNSVRPSLREIELQVVILRTLM